MSSWQSSALVWLVNSLWQAPLIFAATWLAARWARPAGPRLEHRLWVAALFAQLLLPLASLDVVRFQLSDTVQSARAFLSGLWHSPAAPAVTRLSLGPATAVHPRGLQLTATQASVLLLLYAACLLYSASRLLWGLWNCRALRSCQLAPDAHLSAKFAAYCHAAGVRHASLFVSSDIAGPQTVGIWHPRLLLPQTFASRIGEADLDALFAHEAAHMQRADFAKNLFYTALSLPLSFHPALWLVRHRIAASRELICDALAADATASRQSYAHSLLRMAALFTAPPIHKNLHAIGIFDANIFEKRVMQMMENPRELQARRRLLIAAGCAALALATASSAWALHLPVNDKPAGQTNPKSVHVNQKSLTIVTKVNPIYPIEAKKAKIQGAVVLSVIIGTSGEPENISAKSGPRELQQSAIDAVRQWRWQPYLLNGEPIAVETEINVIYSLAG